MGSKQSIGELQTTATDRDHKNPNKNTCQICECLFYYPVSLPCGHSFCEACIEVHWELESKQTEFLCPQKKCGQRWESKPTLEIDTTLATLVEPARQKFVSETLDEIRQAAKEGGATDEGNTSSPQSSTPAQGSGEEWREACSELVEIFPEWKAKKIEDLKMIAGMMVQLRKSTRDDNISKVIGSSVGIVSGVLAITGSALIPVTLGTSLGLSIAGAAIGVVGSIKTMKESIYVLVTNDALTKEVTENIEKDEIVSAKLANAVQSIYSVASELEIITMESLAAKRVSTTEGIWEKIQAAFRGFFGKISMAIKKCTRFIWQKIKAFFRAIVAKRSVAKWKWPSCSWQKIKAFFKPICATGSTVKGIHTIVDKAIDLAGAAKVAAAGANVADDVASLVVRKVASRSLPVFGIVVSSGFLVAEIASLIKTGVALYKGSPSEIEEHWQKTYDDLKMDLIHKAKINDYVQRIRK